MTTENKKWWKYSVDEMFVALCITIIAVINGVGAEAIYTLGVYIGGRELFKQVMKVKKE